jgi:hypothetical protein
MHEARGETIQLLPSSIQRKIPTDYVPERDNVVPWDLWTDDYDPFLGRIRFENLG